MTLCWTQPLYGIAEAAGYLAIPSSTFTTWAFGCQRRQPDGRAVRAKPVITAIRAERPNEASVPFIGRRIRRSDHPSAIPRGRGHDRCRHAFGRPRFARGGAKIEDAIDLGRAGEPVDVVAEEYGLTRDEIEDVLRVATRTAA
ncbi:hypothetical protein [Nonomuraea sp. NPDC048826]|uniref:hypothetical protein n=1 Tax=Nonomuraea sp. NPDC048826 TaxID=3364347 RepID=UPI00371F582F